MRTITFRFSPIIVFILGVSKPYWIYYVDWKVKIVAPKEEVGRDGENFHEIRLDGKTKVPE